MKTMNIDTFLSWAFVHELAKGGGENGLQSAGSAWGAITGMAQLGTLIDTGHYASSMYVDQGDPHPDAIKAGRAVARLADCDIAVPAVDFVSDWPDAHGLLPDAVGAALERYNLRRPDMRRKHIVNLVICRAVLGRGPDWQADAPKQRMVTRSNQPVWFIEKQVRDSFGRMHTVEIDGRNPRSRRPRRGAYRKYELAHDPVGELLDRIDWVLWGQALQIIHADLRGKLSGHALRPPKFTQNPWKPLQNPHAQTLDMQGLGKRVAV